MKLDAVFQEILTPEFKGFPYGAEPLRLDALGHQGWNLLQGDLPLPVAILKESALRNNSAWMRRFTENFGVRIAPHGKTTMAPQLFQQQLQDGAWGITVANVHQLRMCRKWGVSRGLITNQEVGPQELRGMMTELRESPELEVFCLVDSVVNVRQLAEAATVAKLEHPLLLLLELGVAKGRTGCRTETEALAVARAVKNAAPRLHLRGVEGFEGLFKGRPDAEAQVQEFLLRINQVAERCSTEGLFAEGPVILTAGGSDFYDLVVQKLESPSGAHEVLRVIRSGCYLTHDSEYYQKMFRRIRERSPQVNDVGGGLQPALQVWGAVQSLPEPGLAIVTTGKRDLSYDVALPVPELHFRLGSEPTPTLLNTEHFRVTALNDQHAYLTIPEDADWQVGDLVGLGISHPCTTFDKWRLLYLVDDDWNVSGGIRTYLA